MSETWTTVIDNTSRVFPEIYFPVLILCAVLIMIAAAFKNKEIRFFISCGIFTAVCLLLPPVISFISLFTYEGMSYWRTFWLIPFCMYIGIGGVLAVTWFKKKALRVITAVLIAVLICLAGKNVFYGGTTEFSMPENPEKIPPIVIEAAEIIEKNSEETGVKRRKVAVPQALTPYVRQVDGNIWLLFGRGAEYDPDNEEHRESAKGKVWLSYMGYSEYDKMVPEALAEMRTNYILIPKNDGRRDILEEAGFRLIGDLEGYDLLYSDAIQ